MHCVLVEIFPFQFPNDPHAVAHFRCCVVFMSDTRNVEYFWTVIYDIAFPCAAVELCVCQRHCNTSGSRHTTKARLQAHKKDTIFFWRLRMRLTNILKYH